MELFDNYLIFESDEEFEDFCIAPFAEIKRSEDGSLYCSGRHSEEYKSALAEGKKFIIKDRESKVYKRKVAIKRVPVVQDGRNLNRDVQIQLHVDNLESPSMIRLIEKMKRGK